MPRHARTYVVLALAMGTLPLSSTSFADEQPPSPWEKVNQWNDWCPLRIALVSTEAGEYALEVVTRGDGTIQCSNYPSGPKSCEACPASEGGWIHLSMKVAGGLDQKWSGVSCWALILTAPERPGWPPYWDWQATNDTTECSFRFKRGMVIGATSYK